MTLGCTSHGKQRLRVQDPHRVVVTTGSAVEVVDVISEDVVEGSSGVGCRGKRVTGYCCDRKKSRSKPTRANVVCGSARATRSRGDRQRRILKGVTSEVLDLPSYELGPALYLLIRRWHSRAKPPPPPSTEGPENKEPSIHRFACLRQSDPSQF